MKSRIEWILSQVTHQGGFYYCKWVQKQEEQKKYGIVLITDIMDIYIRNKL